MGIFSLITLVQVNEVALWAWKHPGTGMHLEPAAANRPFVRQCIDLVIVLAPSRHGRIEKTSAWARAR
jgi:hypothetical protein